MTELDWLRHNTRRFMLRHRVIRWVPLAEPLRFAPDGTLIEEARW